MRIWLRQGEHWIWLNGAAVTINIIMVVGLLLLIFFKGMGYFWPSAVERLVYQVDGKEQVVAGAVVEDALVEDANDVDAPERRRYFIKTANRKLYGVDFRWLWADQVQSRETPVDVVVLERTEWGDFYGFFQSYSQGDEQPNDEQGWQTFTQAHDEALDIVDRLFSIRKHEIGTINGKLEKLRLSRRKLDLAGEDTPENLAALAASKASLDRQYQELTGSITELTNSLQSLGHASFQTASGEVVDIAIGDIIHYHMPNDMNLFQQIGFYFYRFWNFLTGEPREANTEGGIFPAIFGTVMMVFLMTLITTPFGVVAAVYLREYARQGFIVRLIRISVNNLAGVPSIVYGVFGLGFFVYFLGANIDKWFYPEALPAPTFGTPGLLWASVTLALLTLPVVIVSTEEGLARIPKSLREGSLALGATRFETLRHVILPMASPAIMTGVILAIARAAGEVAPLMLVGVVKLAPDLVVDTVAPFVHLERKFMHLGFHIFDLGFQSPNVDAARPLVFATSFLLVLVIILLNLTAIWVRNRLRERYKELDQ